MILKYNGYSSEIYNLLACGEIKVTGISFSKNVVIGGTVICTSIINKNNISSAASRWLAEQQRYK